MHDGVEAAQPRSPATDRLDWPLIAAGFAAVAVNGGFARFAFTPLLPSMAAGLGRSVAATGMLVTVNLLGYVVGSAVSAVLLRRRPAATVAVIGMWGCSTMLVGIAASPSLAVAAVPSVLTGFFGALGFIGMAGVVNGSVTTRRGVTMGYATGGMGGGTIIASVLAGILISLGPDGWRLTWLALAALASTATLLAGPVLRSRQSSRPSSDATQASGPTRGRVWVFGAYVSFAIGYIIVATYLTAYLQEERGVAPSAAALAFSLTGVAAMVGGPAIGRLSDRFGRRGMFVTALAVAALGIMLVLRAQGFVWAALGALLFGLPVTGVASIAAAVVGESWEPRRTAAIFGLLTFVFGLAQAAGPTIGAVSVVVTGSLDTAFAVSLGALAVSALCAWQLPHGAPSRSGPGG